MSLKLIIFDLDGTLLDTLADLADAANEALAGAGLPPHPTADYRYMVGLGARNLMLQAATCPGLPGPDPATIEQLLTAFATAYEKRWHDKTRPYPGIDSLISHLADYPVRMAVLSNKPDTFTQKMVKHFFPDRPFVFVKGLAPEFKAKPDPALTLSMLDEAGVSLEEAALIGDSGTDMQTAVAANILPIGVLWGFREADELETAGARLLVKTPVELENALSELIQP